MYIGGHLEGLCEDLNNTSLCQLVRNVRRMPDEQAQNAGQTDAQSRRPRITQHPDEEDGQRRVYQAEKERNDA